MVIRNTGILPADEVSVVVEFGDGIGNVRSLSAVPAHEAICFPDERIVLSYSASDLLAWLHVGGDSVMRVKVDYTYGRGKRGAVGRAFTLAKSGVGEIIFSPVVGEAYWV